MSSAFSLLAIDQGTSSSRAMIFNQYGITLHQSSKEFTQYYPQDGWVEHDALEILSSVNDCLHALKEALPTPSAVGITNQRETTVVWERTTGKPIYHAIVWQDRRTAPWCKELDQNGHATMIQEKTGLLLDPYFSATKLSWILDHVEGARAKADAGQLAFGTIDCFLLWHLTGGKHHATDATNASRTMLYNIHTHQFDEELLELFRIPQSILPIVKDSSGDFGSLLPKYFGKEIPIRAMIGDQQAAAFGQGCFKAGMMKTTYGTGCFMLMHTGSTPIRSHHRLLTTIALQHKGTTTYALEGSLFIAGAAVTWLKHGAELIGHASETEHYARMLPSTTGLMFVPALTGLGAPYWNPDARGAWLGISCDTSKADLIRAVLESIAYQTHDLVDTMEKDSMQIQDSRVDGGMVTNRWLMQYVADILGKDVIIPIVKESTAFGAALLAGLGAGLYCSLDEITSLLMTEHTYRPALDTPERDKRLERWKRAINAVQAF